MRKLPIVTIASERCKRCFSCVRSCPAKAIRVLDGQAQVITERCISCGWCVTICSQNVKRIVGNLDLARQICTQDDPVIMLAPSFPAAFPNLRPGQVIAALRKCGFGGVYEVAFGADIVSMICQKLYRQNPNNLFITSPCPAAVYFIEKFAEHLVPFIMPVFSPMAAMGKILKTKVRPGCKIVFAGPCSAKICESQEEDVKPWIDCVITFPEVEEYFRSKGINPTTLEDEEFDPPHSFMGGIYPVEGGLIRAAGLPTDVFQNEVHHVSGKTQFTDLIAKLNNRVMENKLDSLQTRFFDVLFCKGCIDGPVMPRDESILRRKERIVHYLKSRPAIAKSEWEKTVNEIINEIDFSRSFKADPQNYRVPDEETIRQILKQTNKTLPEHELNCGACGYKSCREKAIAVYNGLAEVEMCLPYMIEKLEATIKTLHLSYDQLTETRIQLSRSEKLASMGQMAAGIAHEVNNPLGTILIYAHLLRDNPDCLPGLKTDVMTIIQEAIRCKGIVGDLLNFARQNKVIFALVDLHELLEKAASIVRSQTEESKVEIVTEMSDELHEIRIDRDQILQVLINLLKNSVEAMPNGGLIRLSAEYLDKSNECRILVVDQGTGIPDEAMEKIFSPFFSTKPVGKGTGLGLAICYGIIKMHRGRIRAFNNTGTAGTTFEICLPLNDNGSEETGLC